MGGTSMGITGSIVDPSFFEAYLGMRVEAVDMSEFVRRFDERIYDQAKFKQALAWVRANCREGKDDNPPHRARSREQKDGDWAAAALDGTGQMAVNGRPGIKRWWEVTPEDVEKRLEVTTWHAGMTEYFRGGGWPTGFTTRGGMPVTMSRLNLIQGLGPALQIAEGVIVELPGEAHAALDERTNPTWPTTWFAPRVTGQGAFRDVYTVMYNWGANHGAFSYGHIGADLISLASMLRIPVYMHNVAEEKVYRPTAWNAFGTADLEGADFRACAAFGPLYGRY